MNAFSKYPLWCSFLFSSVTAQVANITLFPVTTSFESDNTAFIYSRSPLLLANDGSAADGGFRLFSTFNTTLFEQKTHKTTGRSKIAVPVYGVAGRDVIVNIPAPDSVFRVFDAHSLRQIDSGEKNQLGDWSTACVWRSQNSGENHLFLFGKRMVVQFLIRGKAEEVEILEASDSTITPEITMVREDVEVAGLATYYSSSGDYLLIAHDESIDVYDEKIQQKGTIALNGIAELSIEGGLSVLQSALPDYPLGVIAIAFEGEDITGVAVGSLEGVLEAFNIKSNTEFNPRDKPCRHCKSDISKKCSNHGYIDSHQNCSCFVGFTGRNCSRAICENSCSGHGKCTGPKQCKCSNGWTGPDCSFVAAQAKYETEANGGDGDDPAIWIHATNPGQSKIITTTKSEQGQGFGVFDLEGRLLQHISADEPNNVDIIYKLPAGNHTIDLAYAACRGDNTLCLVEVTSTGSLQTIAGGTQLLPENYEPYGSCTYRSPKTHKQFLFVNNKEAKYLQFELTSAANGTLQTTLVREFTGGSGGQVEGCVADEASGYIFLGEEPSGIWRYEAEPDSSNEGVQIAKVGENGLHADVEGLTLIPNRNGTGGYIFVSSQGISAYLVYQRAPPHEYVMTFSIVENKKESIDHVSNTDGIAAVGHYLNADFPCGLFVTHDDANELVEGGTGDQASFKLVSLVDVIGEERCRTLGY
ncbi:thermostable phytase [Dothidotthia symphoricarpi CBS 119687]|uniref:Thermostable phytase n=1 Tax=Dothidotthia symphoricarpi CBS 119687 TaxID=1392245 RepID=A0A6A6A1I4_9PLEO|nr:thermostable phytase [Dothidotthia symphoricarpi CBS 119687]KAF2125386.1 thermostable phytase [Dothidotthia symphoricarpi CBS 119687]